MISFNTFFFFFLSRKRLLQRIFLSYIHGLVLFCSTKILKESHKGAKIPGSFAIVIKDGWNAEVVDGGDPLGDYDGQTRAERRRDIREIL